MLLMNKDKYDWNRRSVELSKHIQEMSDEHLWKLIHKALQEQMRRMGIDWRLNG